MCKSWVRLSACLCHDVSREKIGSVQNAPFRLVARPNCAQRTKRHARAAAWQRISFQNDHFAASFMCSKCSDQSAGPRTCYKPHTDCPHARAGAEAPSGPTPAETKPIEIARAA